MFTLRKVTRALWGDLHGKEFEKFFLLALGLFFLIGAWWPLKTTKDSIFINMVGAIHLPMAKLYSVALFFPLILFYSKLVDIFSKEKLVYAFTLIYGFLGFGFVYLLAHPTIGVANTECNKYRIIGWAFYLFCESYISLMLSLYWSFVNDITTTESAARGYGLIIFGTQFGGLLFTLLGRYLSYDENLYSERVPVIVLISVLTFFLVAGVVFLLQRLDGVKEAALERKKQKELATTSGKPAVSFLEGLRLLLVRPYVMGIFGLIFFQEVVSTLMSFQFMILVQDTLKNPGIIQKFLFSFALTIQVISCVFALLGTSFFQRKLGITFSLIAYPLLLGLSIAVYIICPTLQTIFYVSLISKALGFALYQPTKEMLYIPTSRDIKYKSKAWIDMFGLRFSKAAGSTVNELIGASLRLSGCMAFGVIAVWLVVAATMGNVFSNNLEKDKIVE